MTGPGGIVPQNLEVEKSVLGGIAIDSTAMAKVIDIVSTRDFYSEKHKIIFGAMVALFSRNEPIDLVTLAEEIKSRGEMERAGGLPYIASIVDEVPTAANIKYYAEIVRKVSSKRKIIVACSNALSDAYEHGTDPHDVISKITTEMVKIETGRDGTVQIGTPILSEIKRIEHKYEHKDYHPGFRTGFPTLDKETGGLCRGDFIVIAGRPSTGKTAFIVNLSESLLKQTGILFFSMDQSKEAFARRLIARFSMVNNIALRDGKLSPNDWPRVTEAAAGFTGKPFYINSDSRISVDEICNLAKKYKVEKNIGVLMIDYLQQIRRPHKNSENEEIGEITARLKDLARELDIAVILLSQLNRNAEKRPDQRPQMSDLRGSGSIEQDAHVLIFLHWDEDAEDEITRKKGRLEFIISKNKDGRRGKIYIQFDKPIYLMKEMPDQKNNQFG